MAMPEPADNGDRARRVHIIGVIGQEIGLPTVVVDDGPDSAGEFPL